jgi:hypothetical protein
VSNAEGRTVDVIAEFFSRLRFLLVRKKRGELNEERG